MKVCCEDKNNHQISYGYQSRCPGIGTYKFCSKCWKTLEYHLDYESALPEEIEEFERLLKEQRTAPEKFEIIFKEHFKEICV